MNARPGMLHPTGSPIGTQHTGRGGHRRFHATGCRVDGGNHVHGVNGFRCDRCVETVEDRIESLLGRLDKQVTGRW